jgi:hypothetical protein
MKMGWCFGDDAEHDKCRVEYIDWNGNPRKCSCERHAEAPAQRKPRTVKIKRRRKETA